jgi:electron transfer flavoprotein alpha subunit
VIAVVPVRDGRLPSGADATVRECDGRVLLVGSETQAAAAQLRVDVADASRWEVGAYAPSRWARGLSELLAAEPRVVLPGSPDGRDLLGRLASELGRPSYAWCTSVTTTAVVTTRFDGVATVTIPVDGPFVATLVPHATAGTSPVDPGSVRLVEPGAAVLAGARDAQVDRVEDADPTEVDLADADRIVAGGLGLGGAEVFAELAVVAASLRASVGATRPVADRGIVPHERQIGTTGVTVDPGLYLAFGISGAVQHTAGLGTRARIVAVNTDPSCPMMQMADLALVTDAAATVRALAALLGVDP